jgi:hypothetical protein
MTYRTDANAVNFLEIGLGSPGVVASPYLLDLWSKRFKALQAESA